MVTVTALLQYVHTFTVRTMDNTKCRYFRPIVKHRMGVGGVRMRRSVDFLHSQLRLFVPLLLHVRYDRRQRRRTP